MTKKEIYLDLSKLSEAERIEIYTLTNLEYDNYYNYMLYNSYYKIFDCVKFSNHELLENKQEITYEEFKTLINEYKSGNFL